jgi:hypothetical protein
MTQEHVRQTLAAIGVTFRKTGYGDYRLVVRGTSEDSAYYTTDLEDAYFTGLAMSDEARGLA